MSLDELCFGDYSGTARDLLGKSGKCNASHGWALRVFGAFSEHWQFTVSELFSPAAGNASWWATTLQNSRIKHAVSYQPLQR